METSAQFDVVTSAVVACQFGSGLSPLRVETQGGLAAQSEPIAILLAIGISILALLLVRRPILRMLAPLALGDPRLQPLRAALEVRSGYRRRNDRSLTFDLFVPGRSQPSRRARLNSWCVVTDSGPVRLMREIMPIPVTDRASI